ncbi:MULTISPECIES: type II toxin-antitoxin system Phd/YefM family antitoxin [Halomonadaceae]|jgi:prevent-host-death family protein|uniref:Antitoxin n=2 Tax=Vreelandella TaxID=3137766 RepID=A0A653PNN6_9GAMM|nr:MULTISPECIES: type II toxin-antitoxin system prevent-host-death family antitoxin [Halomonas]TDV99216.1 prevent-host-death family protein [Halomonas alkaliantarctica]MBF57641.1 type II toxin-antitoxin system Phd/YefM family antitoxin [Halomonas sp.]MBL1266751.1 type II toxin-antitoxin system Phd/YefM family antitoxin [Halomonas sp.]MCE7519515.1 type II toxin-antitoxin system prevent-host-death family antitoxin [Halomonas titanicae]MDN3559336.1 type II toxin-antitoxin system prevent-host-deat|tara:strand:+ start:614 stop:853 length:240 start_codon:yes stop_codon:yes gene_type:complete
MEAINIHEAKTRLSQLVARAAEGEGFIIAKAGKPMARVTAIDSPASGQQKRLGFLAGQFKIPNDFDRMGQEEIAEMFGG